MKQIIQVSLEEANNIINNLDVNRFNEVIPFPMREDRALKRLEFYRARLREDAAKSETDPTRHTALFLLDRDRYHGASEAGAMIKLAMQHKQVDNDIIRQFSWEYANPNHSVATRIGLWDPIRATPVMNQGHWQESVIKARLESERGYRFSQEELEQLNAHTMSTAPHCKATNDGVAHRSNGMIVTTEMKAIADLGQNEEIDKPHDIHFMQAQVQNMLAADSGLRIDASEIHYPNWRTGLISTFDVKPIPELQELYIEGIKIANEFIEAGYLPNYGKVQVSTLPFNDQERAHLHTLIDTVEVSTLLSTEIEENRKSAMDGIKSLCEEKGLDKSQFNPENLNQGTNRIKGTSRMYIRSSLNVKAVAELAKQHDVYEDCLIDAKLTETEAKAFSMLEENGILTDDLVNKTLDVNLAMEKLKELGYDDEAFYKQVHIISSSNVKSKGKTAESEAKYQYSQDIREVTKGIAASAIVKSLTEKPKVVVADLNQEQTSSKSEEKEVAPTIKKDPGQDFSPS